MSSNNRDHINEVMNESVADSAPIATEKELKSKTNVNDQTAYIIADAFSENPTQLLGQVVEIRKTNGECPTNLVNGSDFNFSFSSFPVTGLKIDEKTRQGQPVLRGSIIVDHDLCAQAGFLNFLSAELKQKETFSLIIMDQAKGIVDFQHESWTQGIRKWKEENQDIMNDPEICYLYVVSGFIQKHIIKKKYIQFETGARGGAYGINVDGKLSMSTDQYSLDIIFGLTPSIIKRPTPAVLTKGRGVGDEYEATVDELKLFAMTTGARLEKTGVAETTR